MQYYLFSLHNVICSGEVESKDIDDCDYRAGHDAEERRGEWIVIVRIIERKERDGWAKDAMPANVIESIEKTLEAEYKRQWAA